MTIRSWVRSGLLAVGLTSGLLSGVPAWADAVTDWNAIAQTTTLPSPPPVGARNMAIVQVAVFDAVNSIERDYTAYAVNAGAPKHASAPAAAIAAAHYALKALYPANAATLDASYATSLAAIPDGQPKTDGVTLGESVAAQILALRANDGASTAAIPYTVPPGIGVWQPTPPAFAPALLPGWGQVTPFTLDSGDQFRVGPPPALTSRAYAQDYEETKTLGSSTAVRDAEHTDVPKFWLPAGTQGWNSAARQVSAANGTSLSENARIFALLNMAGADGLIACWDTKYTYNFWRPIQAIPQGDADGNPRTAGDPSWLPFVVTPPFPEYVSGHACFAGAAKRVLEKFFGDEADKNITLTSPSLPGVSRTYTSFAQIADEIDDARIWGGIHFRFSQERGRKLGKQVGKHGVKNFLRPRRGHDRDRCGED